MFAKLGLQEMAFSATVGETFAFYVLFPLHFLGHYVSFQILTNVTPRNRVQPTVDAITYQDLTIARVCSLEIVEV